MIVEFHGGWNFMKVPWLVGMVALFAFEFVEGNTVTRVYFMRLRRLTGEAMEKRTMTPELEEARGEGIPILFLIVALGAIKPMDWTLFFTGAVLAVAIATVLTIYIPRLYPWGEKEQEPS